MAVFDLFFIYIISESIRKYKAVDYLGAFKFDPCSVQYTTMFYYIISHHNDNV